MNYKSALVQLPLVCEATKTQVTTPADVYAICADLRDLAQEVFHVLLVNTRQRLINRQMVSLGTMDHVHVAARDIFRAAIVHDARNVILVHNHPSGDPSPSAEDIKMTRLMIQAGSILNIRVLDHVIVGCRSDTSPGYSSLRENGTVDFDGKEQK